MSPASPTPAAECPPITREELERLVNDAAARGARQALEAVGLHDAQAGSDVRDLRRLLESWRSVSGYARRELAETLVRFAIKGLLFAVAGAAGWSWLRG